MGGKKEKQTEILKPCRKNALLFIKDEKKKKKKKKKKNMTYCRKDARRERMVNCFVRFCIYVICNLQINKITNKKKVNK